MAKVLFIKSATEYFIQEVREKFPPVIQVPVFHRTGVMVGISDATVEVDTYYQTFIGLGRTHNIQIYKHDHLSGEKVTEIVFSLMIRLLMGFVEALPC